MDELKQRALRYITIKENGGARRRIMKPPTTTGGNNRALNKKLREVRYDNYTPLYISKEKIMHEVFNLEIMRHLKTYCSP